MLDRLAEIKLRVDVNHCVCTGRNDKAVSTGKRRTVHCGIDFQLFRSGTGSHNPKVGKPRKLFWSALPCVHGQSTCGKPVAVACTERAKVTATKEGDQFIEFLGRIEGGVHFQTGDARQFGMFGHAVPDIVSVFEIISAEDQRLCKAINHFENLNRFVIQPTRMKRLNLKWHVILRPAGCGRPEIDVAIVIVGEFIKKRVKRRRRCVGTGGPGLHFRFEPVERKGGRRSGLRQQNMRGNDRCGQKRTQCPATCYLYCVAHSCTSFATCLFVMCAVRTADKCPLTFPAGTRWRRLQATPPNDTPDKAAMSFFQVVRSSVLNFDR